MYTTKQKPDHQACGNETVFVYPLEISLVEAWVGFSQESFLYSQQNQPIKFDLLLSAFAGKHFSSHTVLLTALKG